jgi:uncharacterized delta-60 repeat protein
MRSDFSANVECRLRLAGSSSNTFVVYLGLMEPRRMKPYCVPLCRVLVAVGSWACGETVAATRGSVPADGGPSAPAVGDGGPGAPAVDDGGAAAPDAASAEMLLGSLQIDPTFGYGGTVAGGSTWIPAGLAVAPDGRILVAGFTDDTTAPPSVVVVRLTSDGAVDTSLGSNGEVRAVASPAPFAQSVFAWPDGRLTVYGAASFASGVSAFALRLRADGTSDATFGAAGLVFTNAVGTATLGLPGADGTFLALGADGVVRFRSDGSVDSSFAGGRALPGATAGALGPDGTLLTAQGTRVSRYLDTGEPDTTFGPGGAVDVPLPGPIGAVAVGTDGTATVVGNHAAGGQWYLDVTRRTRDGGADPAFAVGGIVSAPLEPDVGAAALPGGQTAVWTATGSLVVFRPDGTLDPSVGPEGIADLGVLGTVLAGALDANQRLIVVGLTSDTSSQTWFVRRYVL